MKIRLPEHAIDGVFCELCEDNTILVLDENRLRVGYIHPIRNGLVYAAYSALDAPVVGPNKRSNLFASVEGAVRAILADEALRAAEIADIGELYAGMPDKTMLH